MNFTRHLVALILLIFCILCTVGVVYTVKLSSQNVVQGAVFGSAQDSYGVASDDKTKLQEKRTHFIASVRATLKNNPISEPIAVEEIVAVEDTGADVLPEIIEETVINVVLPESSPSNESSTTTESVDISEVTEPAPEVIVETPVEVVEFTP